jgi:hypothetical protein
MLARCRRARLRAFVPRLFACILLAPAWSAARDPTTPAAATQAPAEPWYHDLSLNGFLSVSSSFNTNHPASRTNTLRVFDVDEGSITFDAAELVLQKPVTRSGDAGFRVDAMAGAAIPHVTASAGLFRDASGKAQDFDVHQAYVSYLAPLGRGLRIDAGKFVTPVGYEVIDGYDGINDNATRSFLFGYAIPYTHTGAKVGYAFTDRVSAGALVANGWDTVRSTNGALTVGAQLALTPHPRVNMTFTYLGTSGRATGAQTPRLIDVVATVKITEKLTAAVNADRGSEDGVGAAGSSRWNAVAAYARYVATPKAAFAFRVERFGDPDGARTGAVQTLTSYTLTPEFRPASRIVVRADVRLDHSTANVFETRTTAARHQATVGVNAIYLF